MVLHYESENEYDQMIPVPIERFEQLLTIETLYNRAVSVLKSDIKINDRTSLFRHEVLAMLGAMSLAEIVREGEKTFEEYIKKTVDGEF